MTGTRTLRRTLKHTIIALGITVSGLGLMATHTPAAHASPSPPTISATSGGNGTVAVSGTTQTAGGTVIVIVDGPDGHTDWQTTTSGMDRCGSLRGLCLLPRYPASGYVLFDESRYCRQGASVSVYAYDATTGLQSSRLSVPIYCIY